MDRVTMLMSVDLDALPNSYMQVHANANRTVEKIKCDDYNRETRDELLVTSILQISYKPICPLMDSFSPF